MPVLSMNEVAWDASNVMLSNGQEMSGIRQPSGLARSQDDAMVGYFFQRPQTELAQPYNKRWAVGDDSVIEQVSFILNSLQYHSVNHVFFVCLWASNHFTRSHCLLSRFDNCDCLQRKDYQLSAPIASEFSHFIYFTGQKCRDTRIGQRFPEYGFRNSQGRRGKYTILFL